MYRLIKMSFTVSPNSCSSTQKKYTKIDQSLHGLLFFQLDHSSEPLRKRVGEIATSRASMQARSWRFTASTAGEPRYKRIKANRGGKVSPTTTNGRLRTQAKRMISGDCANSTFGSEQPQRPPPVWTGERDSSRASLWPSDAKYAPSSRRASAANVKNLFGTPAIWRCELRYPMGASTRQATGAETQCKRTR